VYFTKNDVPKATREAIVTLGYGRLVDAIDLQTQCKQARWNAKNASFIAPRAGTGRDDEDALSSAFSVFEKLARAAIDERISDANAPRIFTEISPGNRQVVLVCRGVSRQRRSGLSDGHCCEVESVRSCVP
jgi:hypothetical protein